MASAWIGPMLPHPIIPNPILAISASEGRFLDATPHVRLPGN
jgi:hypothetical protein